MRLKITKYNLGKEKEYRFILISDNKLVHCVLCCVLQREDLGARVWMMRLWSGPQKEVDGTLGTMTLNFLLTLTWAQPPQGEERRDSLYPQPKEPVRHKSVHEVNFFYIKGFEMILKCNCNRRYKK